VNDWNFGIGSIKSIISRLDEAKIDIVEIGFLDNRREYDINRSILPDTDSVKPIFNNLSVKNSEIVAMIDYGTCDIDDISDKKDSPIDGIRVIFKKKSYKDAIDFCARIKDKGYKIFVQPVSITSYTDDEIAELINKANSIHPYGFSIVDTYGLLHKKELYHYFEIFSRDLNKDIVIGYHAHNNFQLAYANAIELMGIDSDRDLIVDSSLYGMGKGAGNTNTELLAMYLNENFGKNYGMNQLLEAIDVDITKEFSKRYWGYSFMHYLAALNDCHPDYVKTLIEKKTLSVNSIIEILSGLISSEKLTFKKDLIEDKYRSYQNNTVDDSESLDRLKAELSGRNILVLAPGKSVESSKTLIADYISREKPVIISINFVSDDFTPNYVFMGNAKRYSQFFNKIYAGNAGTKVICTSNISESNKKIDYKFNFVSLINENALIRDNPFLMLVKILTRIGIRNISIAGLDGYTQDNADNYFGEYIQFLYCADNVLLRNEQIKNQIKLAKESIGMNFITPSLYID
jgi:4-hydroxy 2-oxovalerate aldolase